MANAFQRDFVQNGAFQAPVVLTGGGWRVDLRDPLRFTLKMFTPLPDKRPLPSELVIDPRRTDLSFSTGLPGGFLALRAGVGREPGQEPVYGYLPDSIVDRARAHVELWHGMTLVWEGRLAEVEDVGGLVLGLVAEGYGVGALAEDWYDSTDVTATTSGTILRAMIAAAAPLITVGNTFQFIDPSVSHTYAEFDDMTPADAIDQIVREGSVANLPLDWGVWADQTLWLLTRSAPETPEYIVPVDSTVRRRRNYRAMASEVAVNYTAAGVDTTTARASNAAWRHEFTRRLLISGGELTATGAAQLRQTELMRRAEPEDAITIVRTGGRGLERPGGSEVAPFLVRADHSWVQVGHAGPVVPIIGTDYSASTDQLSVACGYPMASMTAVVSEIRRVTESVKKKINPMTGGRER